MSAGLSVTSVAPGHSSLYPIPLPFVPDDFSFLLASDTFAHGRLTNPTPAMWIHFESIHITMQPTYQSMYFPGAGIAAGRRHSRCSGIRGSGCCMDALMCAAPVLDAAGVAAAQLGAAGRVDCRPAPGPLQLLDQHLSHRRLAGRTGRSAGAGRAAAADEDGAHALCHADGHRHRDAWPHAALRRLLLCLPVAVVLGRWLWKGKNRPPLAVLARRAALPLAVIVAAGAWLGYYDYRAFGKPTTLPYTIDREHLRHRSLLSSGSIRGPSRPTATR